MVVIESGLVWLCLWVALGVAGAAGLALVVRRGIRGFRAAHRALGELGDRLEVFSDTVDLLDAGRAGAEDVEPFVPRALPRPAATAGPPRAGATAAFADPAELRERWERDAARRRAARAARRHRTMVKSVFGGKAQHHPRDGQKNAAR